MILLGGVYSSGLMLHITLRIWNMLSDFQVSITNLLEKKDIFQYIWHQQSKVSVFYS